MDYKEKYEQALEKARELMDKGYDVLMPEIFPELNENEDEKIKREIVAYINELADLKNEKIPTKWLHWLEKQGEQESIDYNEELKKCRENPLYFIDKYVKFEERKPAWSKEDERMRKEIINFLRLPHRQFVGKRDHEKWIDWLERQNKKKSADEVLKIRQELYQRGYNDGYKHGYNHGQNNIAIALGKESIDALEYFVRSIGESGYASSYDNRTKSVYTLLERLKQIVK